jgi:hypothetical protein
MSTAGVMNSDVLEKVTVAVNSFCKWLDAYGEISYDHQSFYAGKLGGGAKALYYRNRVLGTLAVSPMVLCEAFVPWARRFFWKPQRFPIADAHYAMGFAFLAEIYNQDRYYQRAVHFLEVLMETRCPGYKDYCWGYPFDWETRTGTIREGTPLITTLPYAYEAFSQVYAIDKDQRWLHVMRSIAEHAFTSYRDVETAPDGSSCGYTPSPDDPAGVVNASAYRAFLLTKAGIELSKQEYRDVARRNLNFVLANQNEDGSWFYSTDGARDFVDHFHTCFVLKALAKIEQLTGCPRCRSAIERGVKYYAANLFDASGLPKPFSRAPRLTVYRRELYDYAECINLAVLLGGHSSSLDPIFSSVVADLLTRWRKSDGSFRARELLLGWDNVPMHRWAQGQMFRSLCFLLSRESSKSQGSAVHKTSQPLATSAT